MQFTTEQARKYAGFTQEQMGKAIRVQVLALNLRKSAFTFDQRFSQNLHFPHRHKQIKVSRFSRFINMYPQYWTPSIGGIAI